MRSDQIVELDGFTDPAAVATLAALVEKGICGGVVVKGSQGARWENPNAWEFLTQVEHAGAVTGWLHYCEPAAGDTMYEASNILQGIGGRGLSLGIWLELEDLGGVAPSEVGDWYHELAAAVHTPTRPVALVTTSANLDQMAGAPWGYHVVLVGDDPLERTTWWGRQVVGLGTENEGTASATYTLGSTRGIVPVGDPVGFVDRTQADDDDPDADALDGHRDALDDEDGPIHLSDEDADRIRALVEAGSDED